MIMMMIPGINGEVYNNGLSFKSVRFINAIPSSSSIRSFNALIYESNLDNTLDTKFFTDLICSCIATDSIEPLRQCVKFSDT